MLEFLQGLFTLTGSAIGVIVVICGGRHLALSKIGLRASPEGPNILSPCIIPTSLRDLKALGSLQDHWTMTATIHPISERIEEPDSTRLACMR
jgi:hypothetical protein